MAGQHDQARQLPQVLFQKADRLIVEMVGRLIEQQRAELADQQRGQGQPRTLTTRQRPKPTIIGHPGQAQFPEQEVGPATCLVTGSRQRLRALHWLPAMPMSTTLSPSYGDCEFGIR